MNDLADLIRRIRAWLTTPMQTAEYSCGRCGLEMTVTDHPESVRRMLDIGIAHPCKSQPRLR